MNLQDEKLPDRHRPAHFPPHEGHNRAVIIFLTVCTAARRPLLANEAAHAHLRSVWMAADRWQVGRYVIMPDHLHLFCAPGEWPPTSLRAWVNFWKSRAAATWPGERDRKLWQRDHWDTQLRFGESYSEKWDYVRNNPVRAGLAARPEDWPFQGDLNVLRWHD